MLETKNQPQTQNDEVSEILKRMENIAISQEKHTKRLCSLMGLCTLACVAGLVVLGALFFQITPLLAQLSEAVHNLNAASQELASLDLSATVDGFDETLRVAQDSISAIDVEGLNSAIKSLSDVVTPLANIFG